MDKLIETKVMMKVTPSLALMMTAVMTSNPRPKDGNENKPVKSIIKCKFRRAICLQIFNAF